MIPELEINRADLAELCQRFRVRRLALFGSAARGDFDSARSDVDLLIEFEDAPSPGYAGRFLDFALAAERLLGRKIELVTARSVVSPIFKRRIEADAVELYAA